MRRYWKMLKNGRGVLGVVEAAVLVAIGMGFLLALSEYFKK